MAVVLKVSCKILCPDFVRIFRIVSRGHVHPCGELANETFLTMLLYADWN